MCIDSLFHWKAPLIVNDPMNTSSIPQTMNQFMHRLTLHELRGPDAVVGWRGSAIREAGSPCFLDQCMNDGHLFSDAYARPHLTLTHSF